QGGGGQRVDELLLGEHHQVRQVDGGRPAQLVGEFGGRRLTVEDPAGTLADGRGQAAGAAHHACSSSSTRTGPVCPTASRYVRRPHGYRLHVSASRSGADTSTGSAGCAAAPSPCAASQSALDACRRYRPTRRVTR